MKSPECNIVITMGDPQGIGPEVIVKSLLKLSLPAKVRVTVVGEVAAFAACVAYRKFLKLKNLDFVETCGRARRWNELTAAEAAIDALEVGVDLVRYGKAQALVTAPISKDRVTRAGFPFPGHTEFLCHAFSVKKQAMMLFHDRLRVVLTTIHVPLKDVSRLVTRGEILEKLELTAAALIKQFALKRPRIAVCGLNPHAGENGLIGMEEKKMIVPALREFAKKSPKSVTVIGPVSADTVFHDAIAGKYDAVLCHYHDQALIPLKTTGFYEGVNMTLGLPFVRTSPDHGTAFDMAGKNQANPQSMMAAIRAAINFTN